MKQNNANSNSVKIRSKNSLRLQDFEIESKLGEGAYGQVYLVSKQSTEFALKEISKHKLKKFQKQYVALVEKELLRVMDHPGIQKINGAFQSNSKLYLVLEYCEGQEFHDFLIKRQHNIPKEQKVFIMAELVNILEYLHKNGVIHRDLKPQNIMIGIEGHIKLIDFGTAEISNCILLSPEFRETIKNMKSQRYVSKNQTGSSTESNTESEKTPRKRKRKSTFVGSSHYISPELIELNECEAPADLWALGCILYTLNYGKNPFHDTCEIEIFQKIRNAVVQYPQNYDISEEAVDLIKKLLVKNPYGRIGSGSTPQLSFDALKSHPFFKGIDVDSIFSQKRQFASLKVESLTAKIERLKPSFNQNWEGFDSQDDKILEDIFSRKECDHSQKEKLFICTFLKNMTLLEKSIQHPEQQQIYKLKSQGGIAHLLCHQKISIGIQGDRLIYRSPQAESAFRKLTSWLGD